MPLYKQIDLGQGTAPSRSTEAHTSHTSLKILKYGVYMAQLGHIAAGPVYMQEPDGIAMPVITHALPIKKKESTESLRGAAWLYRRGTLHIEIPQCGRHPFV